MEKITLRAMVKGENGTSAEDFTGLPLKYYGRDIGVVIIAYYIGDGYYDVRFDVEENIGRMMLAKLINIKTFSVGKLDLVDNICVPEK